MRINVPRQQQRIVTQRGIVSPVGGWNTRDALDSMKPEDATTLDNWVPGLGQVTTRKGREEWSGSMGSATVKTLAEFHSGATRKLVACTDGKIYDATSATASSLATGFGEDEWSTCMFNKRLFLVNGTDAPQDFDGTTVSATAWTGPTIADLIHVHAHKARLYFVEKESQSFWYGGVNAVSGSLTEFDLSRVGNFGGNLVATNAWTIDGGAGPDDYLAAIMSSGEVVVYSGSNPGSDFSLVGVYRMAQPINRRSLIKSAGDLVIATKEDYVSMSDALRTGQTTKRTKLCGAIKDASSAAATGGWQMTLWREGQLIISNVPTATAYQQHIINTATGAPGRWTNIPAYCWAVYNGALLFGATDGKVYEYTGNDDDGANIECDGQAAWTHLGVQGAKRVAAARPILKAAGALSYQFGLAADFNTVNVQNPDSVGTATTAWGSPWGSSWSGTGKTDRSWRPGGAFGETIACRIRVATKKEISWLRTDYRIERSSTL